MSTVHYIHNSVTSVLPQVLVKFLWLTNPRFLHNFRHFGFFFDVIILSYHMTMDVVLVSKNNMFIIFLQHFYNEFKITSCYQLLLVDKKIILVVTCEFKLELIIIYHLKFFCKNIFKILQMYQFFLKSFFIQDKGNP